MKAIITTVTIIIALIIGGLMFHPVESIKTAEVVKTDETGQKYLYEEYEGYNVFGYMCCHQEITTW